MATFKQISELHAIYREDLLNAEGVFAVGIGKRATDCADEGYTLNIYATEERIAQQLKKSMPKSLSENKYQIIVAPECKESVLYCDAQELAAMNTDQGRYRPMLGGIQLCLRISETGYHLGTLCAFVKRRNDTEDNLYMLSNRHVLTPLGNTVLQPLLGTRNMVGSVVVSEVYGNADAAIALVNNPDEVKPRYLEEIGTVTETGSITEELIGRRVIKRGRTTGLTEGTIETIHAYVSTGDNHYVDCVFVRADEGKDFSRSGDSGSPVVLKDENKLIGLHFAGNSSSGGRHSIFCTIDNVFDDLEIELAK